MKRGKSHTRGGREKGVSQTRPLGKTPTYRERMHTSWSASSSYYIKREMSSGKEHKNAKI